MTAMPAKRVQHPQASQRVLEYLRANPNVLIPYTEVTHAMGWSEKWATNNAIQLLAEKGIVDRPVRGMVIYRTGSVPPVKPEPVRNDKLYEYVGASYGTPVVRGEDSELYVLIPLADYIKGVAERS